MFDWNIIETLGRWTADKGRPLCDWGHGTSPAEDQLVTALVNLLSAPEWHCRWKPFWSKFQLRSRTRKWLTWVILGTEKCIGSFYPRKPDWRKSHKACHSGRQIFVEARKAPTLNWTIAKIINASLWWAKNFLFFPEGRMSQNVWGGEGAQLSILRIKNFNLKKINAARFWRSLLGRRGKHKLCQCWHYTQIWTLIYTQVAFGRCLLIF